MQVLGQTSLHFELSISQILVALATSALLEVGIVRWRRHVVAWPTSALLTGNGVALLLRVPGTRHGDWWTLHGAGTFAGVAAVSLLSKYVIRLGGRHLFNPSNIGLLLGFLVLGTRHANPQDFWWGRMSPGLALTYAAIVVGGLVITRRLGMLVVAGSFWLTFAAAVGVVAASGHCMTARWHVGPVCGWSFWTILVTSPEVLVFMFFMITDPRTTPRRQRARVVHGMGVALAGALFAAPQRTEFATKVALLGGLALLCAARPWLERLAPTGDAAPPRRPGMRTVGLVAGATAAVAGLLVVAGGPARRVSAAAVSGQSLAPAVSAVSIPPVSVDPEVGKVDASVTPAMARRMAGDLLAALQARVGPAVLVGYRLQHLTVVVVRDPSRPQDSPQLGIRARGPGFDHTYVLQRQGDRYVIASDTPG